GMYLLSEAQLGAAPAQLRALRAAGRAERVSGRLYAHADVLAEARQRILALLERDGSTTLAAVRDALGISRKSAQAFLEHLDGARDEADLCARARQQLRPSLRRVLNATGVVIHTNLGRAPLAEPAIMALLETVRGYGNLELDLASGSRGARDAHVSRLLCEVT